MSALEAAAMSSTLATEPSAESQSLQQIRSGLRLCSLHKVATLAAVMKRSRAKSRDDITALMHVTYSGEDAIPLQQDTDM